MTNREALLREREELEAVTSVGMSYVVARLAEINIELARLDQADKPAEPGLTIENDGNAIIENGALIIRIDLSALPQIVEGAWATGNLSPRYKITNIEEFAADLARELNYESEDGSTRIHRMFDAAIEKAIAQGAFGIEEHEDQDV